MSPAVPPLATVTAKSVRPSRVKSKQMTSSVIAGVTSIEVFARLVICGRACRIAAFAAAREQDAAGAASAPEAAIAVAASAMNTTRRKNGTLDAEAGLPLNLA